MSEDKIVKIYRDLAYSASKYSKLHKEIKKDIEFVQGKQWDESVVADLRAQGVKALTINKCKPIIKLITGIERQSKSDFIASPEGEEDQITADITSRLIKNVVKKSKAEQKLSEQFKHGVIGGLAYLEPFIDYSFDLINGELQFKKVSALDVFPDPDGQEYDLSDHRFLIKITKDLSEDDLHQLFPDNAKQIKNISNGKIDIDALKNVSEVKEALNYAKRDNTSPLEQNPVKTFDLLDYYYKKLVDNYYVALPSQGLLQKFPSKEEAEAKASEIEGAVVIRKKVPEIYICQVVGQEVLYEGVVWTYPAWRNYPLIPFIAEYITEELSDKALSIQGVVRSIRDLQEEFNKRRTQELRHLNSSANSGFDIESGQLDAQNLEKLKRVGSSPGVVIERKANTPPLVRITPMPLSQGHAQLAEENAQDLKEASGVNPDLLANDSQSQSGRAILLKQRQGLVMVQEILDNFAQTKELVGRFILSQLREVYTIETAMKVLGDAFISEAFTVPVTMILQRGLQKVQNQEQPTEVEQSIMLQYPQQQAEQPILNQMGEVATTVDYDTAYEKINEVLTDDQISNYNISIGEGPFAETIRMSNFMEITDLAKQGMPIPPDVLIGLSSIPENEKKRIINSIQQQQILAAQAQQKPKQQQEAQ